MRTQVKTTVTDLQGLDAKGELKSAFANSSACNFLDQRQQSEVATATRLRVMSKVLELVTFDEKKPGPDRCRKKPLLLIRRSRPDPEI